MTDNVEDQDGLKMDGLTEAMEKVCRTEHAEFLKRRNLKSFPLRVELKPVINSASGSTPKYSLYLEIGQHTRHSHAETSEHLERELPQMLKRDLESDFRNHHQPPARS